MIGWWTEAPVWVRVGIASIFLAISTIFLIAGEFWPWGWAVGVVLLIFSGKSDSEKKGYRF
jgi:hypothetical protein